MKLSKPGISTDGLFDSDGFLTVDQVYVSGLPHGTTEADLASHFGSIGMIKEDKQKGKLKIWLYQDKATGEMKV